MQLREWWPADPWKQEAQQSQRGRATLDVVGKFAKLPPLDRSCTTYYFVCHCNYSSTLYE